MYCQKCGSKLYPDDTEYVTVLGVCGYCATWVESYKKLWAEHLAKVAAQPISKK